jgi:hypothetical protein
VERPAQLLPGAVWKVRMHDGALRWTSRTVVVAYDPAARTLVHRSGTDDDNPSYSEWSWTVTPAGTGSTLTVSWELHPRTWVRRVLVAPMRARRLQREVPASLAKLAKLAERRAATASATR